MTNHEVSMFEMAAKTNTAHDFAVKISTGRFVSFGHEVVNFNTPCVVTGYNVEQDELVLRIVDETCTGGLQPGSFLAPGKNCK